MEGIYGGGRFNASANRCEVKKSLQVTFMLQKDQVAIKKHYELSHVWNYAAGCAEHNKAEAYLYT